MAEAKGINTIIFTSSVAIYSFTPLGSDESGFVRPVKLEDGLATTIRYEFVEKIVMNCFTQNKKGETK